MASDLLPVLSAILDKNNQVRKQAEAALTEKRKDPPTLILGLVEVLRTRPEEQFRKLSAVLLRKLLVSYSENDDSLWKHLAPPHQAAVKEQLLAAVEQEREQKIRKQICDTVCEIGAELVSTNQWPELLPFMFNIFGHNDDFKEASLLMFTEFALTVQPVLTACLNDVVALLQQGLSSQNQKVQLAGIRCFSALAHAFGNIANEKQKKACNAVLQPLFPAVLQGLAYLLQTDEEMAQTTMECFIEIADSNARFFLPHIGALLHICTAAATTATINGEKLEDGVRHLALEVLVTVAENAPSIARGTPDYVKNVLSIVIAFMLEVEEDLEWEKIVIEGVTDDEITSSDVAQDAVDRFVKAVKAQSCFPVLVPCLQSLLTNADWKYRFAAFMAITQTIEYVEDAEIMNALVSAIVAHVRDPIPRVRYGAIHCINSASQNSWPDTYKDVVFPALVTAMDDPCQAVISLCDSALCNFLELLDADVVRPFVESLLSKLFVHIQTGALAVKQNAITCIAVLSSTVDKEFVKYYNHIVGPLKQILQFCTEKKDRMLRGKALECLSILGQAVGRDMFESDAREIMQYILTFNLQEMDPDDPQRTYFLEAMHRICETLGDHFLPYLAHTMPVLMHTAGLAAKQSSLQDDEEDDEEADEVSTAVGDHKMSMRTSALEEKTSALEMLQVFARTLKGDFAPYVHTIAPVILELTQFLLNEDIRCTAVETLPLLIRCVQVAVHAQQGDVTVIKTMLDTFLVNIVEAIENEWDMGCIDYQLTALKDCILVVGENCLTDVQLQHLGQQLTKFVYESFERRLEREKAKDVEDVDDIERAEIDEENQTEEHIQFVLAQCIEAVFSTHKASSLHLWETQFLPIVERCISVQMLPSDRKFGFFIATDFTEQLGPLSVPYWPKYMDAMLHACTDAAAEVRQCAVYGVGIAAKFCGPAFQPYVDKSLAALHAVITAPNARANKAIAMPTENAISAVGKICLYQSAACNTDRLLPLWLSQLPLKYDDQEGMESTSMLISYVEQSHSAVIGANYANLSHILKVFAQVYGTKHSKEDLNQRIGRIVCTLQSTVAEPFQSAWGTLTQEQQTKLSMAVQKLAAQQT